MLYSFDEYGRTDRHKDASARPQQSSLQAENALSALMSVPVCTIALV
jgi:hypothetical protein